MRIQHNIMAMNAYRNYSNNTSALSKNLEKLSSGYRINRAGDDAAGLAISEKMRAQITGLETAQKNAKDGISLVQTAEGALTEVHDMLNRMVELADQSANGTYDNDVDRANLQKELDQLREEVDRIADSANFNGIKLLNGNLSEATGVESSVGGDYGGDGLNSVINGSLGTVNAGVYSEGKAEQQASSSFYMSDTLQATATDGTNAGTSSFTLDLKDGNGGSLQITVTLQTNGTAAGSTASVSMSDILSAIQGGGTTEAAINNVQNGTGTVSITGNVAGTAANLEDVFDLYNIQMSNGGTQLEITARTAASASADSGATVKASDLGINNFTLGALATVDKEAMQKELLEDLAADGTPDYVTLGSQQIGAVTGRDAVDPTYELASAQFEMNAGVSVNTGDALKIGDMTYIMKKQGEELVDELKNMVSASGGKIVVVEFNAASANGTDGSAANQLVNAINTVKGTTHIAATVSGNTITLQETTDYGNQIATNGPDTFKPTDISSNTVGNSNIKLNQVDAKNQITFSGTGKDSLQVGTTMKIGGKTYEFAASADKVKEGNVFIQFTANNNQANAQALADALNAAGVTASVTANSAGDPMVEFSKDTDIEAMNCKGLTLQIGDTSDDYNQLSVLIDATDCESLGIDASKVSIADQTSAADAVDILKEAINKVSSIRGTLGATQNRLDHTINNLSVMTENIQDAESTIRDTDVADEMMAYTKNNILIQSAQAMLAQANQVPQGVLQLLQ